MLESICEKPVRSGETQHFIIENPAEKVEVEGKLPDRIHVIDEPHGAKLILNPMSAGTDMWYLNQRSTRNMITSMKEEFLPLFRQGRTIRVINIPNGGNAMDFINPASELVFKNGVPSVPVMIRSFMKLSRRFNQEIDDYETFLQGYSDNGENKIYGDVYVILDFASASGSTLYGALKIACEGCRKGDFRVEGSMPALKKVFVFLGIGSLESIIPIYKYCLEKGLELIPVYSSALFQVTSKNNVLRSLRGKTDLPIFNQNTITTLKLNRLAYRVYKFTRICAAGDTGNRLMLPHIFYMERLCEIEELASSGTPIPIEEPEWRLADLLLKDPFIKNRVPVFNQAMMEGKELSHKELMEIKNRIHEIRMSN